MLIQRRSFLTGLAAAFAAPAIVRADSLMKVRGIILPAETPNLIGWRVAFRFSDNGGFTWGDVSEVGRTLDVGVEPQVAMVRNGSRLTLAYCYRDLEVPSAEVSEIRRGIHNPNSINA